jgi:Holliday junction resolvase RusA-like endonuclease
MIDETNNRPPGRLLETRTRVVVRGVPAPQGSKRGFVVKGRAVLVESSAKVRPWREDVRHAVMEHFEAPLVGAVWVGIVFRLPRPRSVSVKSRPAPVVKPDLDKLLRSTLDALKSAGAYGDDSQVVEVTCSKVYADDVPPGAVIEIGPVKR